MARGRRPAVTLSEPAGQSGAGYQPDPPADLAAAALAKWRQIVPLIAGVCQLRDTDADALRQYCEAATIRAKALRELEESPLVCISPNGAQQINPLVKIADNAGAVMLKLAERFGLDPASRKRLQIAAQGKGSKLAEFLSGAGRTHAPVEAE